MVYKIKKEEFSTPVAPAFLINACKPKISNLKKKIYSVCHIIITLKKFTEKNVQKKLQYKPKKIIFTVFVGSVVEWLKRRACDQHGLGSKPTRAILLCSWERHTVQLKVIKYKNTLTLIVVRSRTNKI